MALRHNHTLQAARTTIQQNQAAEITATCARIRRSLPIGNTCRSPNRQARVSHSTSKARPGGDMGLSYLIGARQQAGAPPAGGQGMHRGDAARRWPIPSRYGVPGGRSLRQFAQLAESTLALARMDLESFQATVEIAQSSSRTEACSENDYLKMKAPVAAI